MTKWREVSNHKQRRRIAIVFDGAGVIYEPVRIVKDMESGDIRQSKLSGIHLTDKVGGAFVMIRAKMRELMRGEACSETLSHFLLKRKIPIVVIYKSNRCRRKLRDEDVKDIVLSDDRVRLGDVYDTITILLKYKILPVIGTGLVVSAGCEEGRSGRSGRSEGAGESDSGEIADQMRALNVRGGERRSVRYVISGGINLFPEIINLFEKLRSNGVEVFIASGDRIERDEISPFLPGVSASNIFGMLSPDEKCKLVKRLRNEYDKVIMVGDDKNDYYAMCAADVSVLSLQIESERPKKLFDIADFVIRNIGEVERIVNELLILS
ncbi:MAG: HAD family hydrolase [Canidatus Methanoxibalbensis ujae]|nr:HAD family hydrolase [Candidatus Methanoxibalbensis ujae]MCW7077925.1 HAD family hydrolase [Candidatus Methanoxibalbensis ujae]